MVMAIGEVSGIGRYPFSHTHRAAFKAAVGLDADVLVRLLVT